MKIEKPNWVEHGYTQHLQAPASQVFELLCPVREADWIEGWDPLLVLSESGLAEPECVFITPAEPADAVWFISRHDPAAGRVEMIKTVPGLTVCRLAIAVRDVDGGSEADVRYRLISLGPQGDAAVAAFTAEHYRDFMQAWQRRLNHYLATGQRLAESEL